MATTKNKTYFPNVFIEEPHPESKGWQGWLNSTHAVIQVAVGFLLFVWYFYTLQIIFISMTTFDLHSVLEVAGADVMINA